MENEALAVLMRRYPSHADERALGAFAADPLPMAAAGCVPIGQSSGWHAERDSSVGLGASRWRPGPGTLAFTDRREPGRPS